MKLQVKDFENVLRSYRWVEKRLEAAYWRIQEKENELTGLTSHGVKMTPEQERSGKPMPRYSGGGRSLVDRICELDEIKKEYEGLKALKTSTDLVLDRMASKDRELVIAYYCDRVSADKLAERYGYAGRSPLYRRLQTVIKQNL